MKLAVENEILVGSSGPWFVRVQKRPGKALFKRCYIIILGMIEFDGLIYDLVHDLERAAYMRMNLFEILSLIRVEGSRLVVERMRVVIWTIMPIFLPRSSLC